MYSFDHDYLGALTPAEEWEERYGGLYCRDDLQYFTSEAAEILPLRSRDVLQEIERRYPHCPTSAASEEVEAVVIAMDWFFLAVRDKKPWREVLHCARDVVKELKKTCFWDGDFSCLHEDDGDDW